MVNSADSGGRLKSRVGVRTFLLCLYVPHGGQRDGPRITKQRCLTKKRETLRGNVRDVFKQEKPAASGNWMVQCDSRGQI